MENHQTRGLETLGQKVIRVNFSKDSNVEDLKKEYARLYDLTHAISTWRDKTEFDLETNRLVEKAKEHLEIAAMFAVKALTLEK